MLATLVTIAQDIVDPDDGETSLREAIDQLQTRSTIRFSPDLDGTPIELTLAPQPDSQLNEDGDLDISLPDFHRSPNIRIVGNGVGNTIISAGGDVGIGQRVFELHGKVSLEISGLTIRGGRDTHGAGLGFAADSPGSLVVDNVVLTDNIASDVGGAISIPAGRGVTLTDTTIIGNSADLGGGIANNGRLSIFRTTVAQNHARLGGGVFSEDGNLRIESSTLSGNVASDTGGAIFNRWVSPENDVDKKLSTITGSTIAMNQADNAAGIYVEAIPGSQVVPTTIGLTLLLENTDNQGSGNLAGNDLGSSFTSWGVNLFDDHTLAAPLESDLVGVDTSANPVISPALADNGGITPTHALVSGSPAINAGPDSYRFPSNDQRNQRRGSHGTAADIGAYEWIVPTFDFAIWEDAVGEEHRREATLAVVVQAFDPSDRAIAGELSLPLSFSGTATQLEDYTVDRTSFTLGPNQNRDRITMSVIDYSWVELSAETIAIEIPDPGPSFDLASQVDLRHELELIDNDHASFSISSPVVDESDGTADFVVSLDAPVDVEVVTHFSTVDGTAISGRDYEGFAQQELRFPPGTTSQTVSVNLIDNDSVDGDRSLSLRMDVVDVKDRAVYQAPVPLNEVEATVETYVKQYRISNDGQRVVALASSELYSAPVAGGTPVLLSRPRLKGHSGEIKEYLISPDSQYVVYLVHTRRHDHPDTDALYRVPIEGGESTRLNDAGEVEDFKISDNSETVVLRIDRAGQFPQWHAVSRTSSTSVRLPFPLRYYGDLQISPDGKYAMVDDIVVSTDGTSDPVQIGWSGASFSDARFVTNTQGTFVVYIGDRYDYHPLGHGIYRVPATGGIMKKLSPSWQRDHWPSHFTASPDGRYVIYSTPGPDGSPTLYRASVADGEVKAIAGATSLRMISSDSQSIFYLNDDAIWQVSIDGGTAVQLTQPGEALDGRYKVTKDMKYLVYLKRESRTEDNQPNLQHYAVPLDGGDTSPIGDAIVGYQDPVISFSYDGSHLFYLIFLSDQWVIKRVEISSGDSETLTGLPTDILNSDYPDPVITRQGDLVYRARTGGLPYDALFRVAADSLAPERLRFSQKRQSTVVDFSIDETTDLQDRRVVFVAISDSGKPSLYSRPMDASQTQVRLSSPSEVVIGGSFEITLDGQYVVYMAERNIPGPDPNSTSSRSEVEIRECSVAPWCTMAMPKRS